MKEILAKFGIKQEDLNASELETLKKWSETISKKQISILDVKSYLDDMIEVLERELFGYETPKSFVELLFRGKRYRHLQARLQNYILLRDVLVAPEKARKFIEKQISNIADKKL